MTLSGTMDKMDTEDKLDYIIEMLESQGGKVDVLVEVQEELVEKVADLGTPFGNGFEFETQ